MENEQFLSELGSRIRKKRQERNMLQNTLATKCSFDTASMSRLESGQTNPTVLTLKRISHALEVSVDELLRDQAA